MWGVFEDKLDEDFTEYHVIPLFGREHDMSMSCWCIPCRDKDTPTVIVHNGDN